MKTESTLEWLQRIGSPEAMMFRQTERLAGRMNKLKPPRGLHSHSLYCQCEKCIPPELEHILNPQPLTKVVVSSPAPKKGFKKPRMKWSEQRGRSGN